jgi:transketolase
LANLNFFPLKWLDQYCKDGGKLGTHPDHFNVPGIEWTTGSLGHGLSVACGMAIGLKYKQSKRKVYVLISDAESQEGEIWEAALTAAQHKLNNLVAILDYNKVQAFGKVKDVLSIEPITDKWKSFGWQVHEVDGHDISALLKIFKKPPQSKPQIIVAHTIRGKGIPFMEHKMEWYYNYPKAEDVEKALKVLE